MEDDPIATQLTHRRTFAGACAVLLLSGCAHLYDPIDESLTCLHCEIEAAHTWQFMRRKYADVCYPHHFGGGFRAGYVSVCRGGSGCPPTLPPKCYWSIWYRNEAGRAKTLEWFNGFAAGVAAAQQAGCDQCGQLVTASDAGGGCDCRPPVEYDLSDLPSQSPPDDSTDTAPRPRTYAPPGITPGFSPADTPWPVLPPQEEMPPMSPPSGSDSTPIPPPVWGHSLPVPPDRTVPRQPIPSQAPSPPHPTFIPSPPEKTDNALNTTDRMAEESRSARLPFGHSLADSDPSAGDVPPGDSEGQALASRLDAAEEPIDVPLTDESFDDGLSDRAAKASPTQPQSNSGQVPLPIVAPKGESTPRGRPVNAPQRRNPDPWNGPPRSGHSPFIHPRSIAPSPPTGGVPADAAPPLEDRFLPRPQQQPVTRSIPDDSIFDQSPRRSLYDVLNRVQQTSHTYRSRTDTSE